MIHIAKAPFRISFFGGGTDYPDWYRQEGGAVLSTSIDKYCYITARYLPPFFPTAYRIVWSHIENVASIPEILHPAVRESLKMMGFEGRGGVEIHHQGDLPARSGMGSSSAFANSLLMALHALLGQTLDQQDLFKKSIALEQDWLKEAVGSQDQVATACGGFNLIRFGTDGAITVDPVVAPPEHLLALNDRLLLVFTGVTRLASGVARDVIANLHARAAALRSMRQMVDEGHARLCSGDLDGFGDLLHEAWLLKRSVSASVSSPVVDEIYETACRHGARGGKLLGAGGAGFMLFYVPPERQEAVKSALRLLSVPFRFERKGAHLIQSNEDDGPVL